MLRTLLTDGWRLRHPIVGAPMAGVGHGRLARAVSEAGGLGMVGVNDRATLRFVREEAAIARDSSDGRFGIGLMAWALERRPELLDAALAERPFAVSISFGSVGPFARRVHASGAMLVTQVGTVAAALAAEAAGADVIVAQGTEAGGHTGRVATLPLLQAVLQAVRLPVLAAGGVSTPRGLAAVLTAGAEGALIGTAFAASPECANAEAARDRLLAASETDTLLTSVFDRVQHIPWPPAYPGRALANEFARRWHCAADDPGADAQARDAYETARMRGDFDTAVIYAGEGVGMLTASRPAGEVVRTLGEGAEAWLRTRSVSLFGG